MQQLWLWSVNDRDSRRREFPAPGELFFPAPAPASYSLLAGNLAGNFPKKNLADLLKFYIYFWKFHNIISVLANDTRHKDSYLHKNIFCMYPTILCLKSQNSIFFVPQFCVEISIFSIRYSNGHRKQFFKYSIIYIGVGGYCIPKQMKCLWKMIFCSNFVGNSCIIVYNLIPLRALEPSKERGLGAQPPETRGSMQIKLLWKPIFLLRNFVCIWHEIG